MPASVLVVQHAADDPAGRIGDALVEAGCELAVVRCDLGQPLPPDLASFAGLLVLGGAMGAHDDADHPWLTPTKALLAEAATRDLPTLAVCLGHQLLAVATSGAVTRAPAPQIGAVGVRLTAEGAADPLFGPLAGVTGPAAAAGDPRAVHFNYDLVTAAPPGAVVLCTTAAGLQAFRLGRCVYGVQFHPEVDVATVAGWAAEEVAAGRLAVAAADTLLAEVRTVDAQLEQTWRAFARRFAEHITQGCSPRPSPA